MRTRTISGIGITMVFLMAMAGTVGATGASYCNISNTTIAAICANLTTVIANISTINTQIAVISSNQTSQGTYITNVLATNQSTLYNSIATLNGNQILLSNKLNSNVSTISGVSSAITTINSNATSARAIAESANANSSRALILSNNAINNIASFNSSLNQKSGILNTNITLVQREVAPIANLNLTGTYGKTTSDASNAGWEGGLALILVIILIIFEVARLIMGFRKKPQQPSLQPVMTAESKAKADKTATDNSNAKELSELREKQKKMDDSAKMDKLIADPEYKRLKAILDKKAPKAKKLDIPKSSLPEYKEIQALAQKYEIKLDD